VGRHVPGQHQGPCPYGDRPGPRRQDGHFSASQPGPAERAGGMSSSPRSRPRSGADGIIAIARDITHQKTAEERVRWAANHDP
jgi:hypothetical protein